MGRIEFRFRTVRLGTAVAVTLWVFIFFVPVVPYWVHESCTSPFCQLIPPNGWDTGYHSLGLLFFHWGASLDTSFLYYNLPVISIVRGEYLTAWGVWIFILFPITIFLAALLIPEERHAISSGLSHIRWRSK